MNEHSRKGFKEVNETVQLNGTTEQTAQLTLSENEDEQCSG